MGMISMEDQVLRPLKYSLVQYKCGMWDGDRACHMAYPCDFYCFAGPVPMLAMVTSRSAFKKNILV